MEINGLGLPGMILILVFAQEDRVWQDTITIVGSFLTQIIQVCQAMISIQ